MNKYIYKSVKQYAAFIKKTRNQKLSSDFIHIICSFLERKQEILDIDDHMMWLNVQNMFENIKKGIEFDAIRENINGECYYDQNKIVINESLKSIDVNSDDDISFYIRVVENQLQHQFDFVKSKDGKIVKCGIVEVKDNEITDQNKCLNDIFNEKKVLQLTEEIIEGESNKKSKNDIYHLTDILVKMWSVAIGIDERQLVLLSNSGYVQFEKKIQELNNEFSKILDEKYQILFTNLRTNFIYLLNNNDEKTLLEIANLFEENYIFCMNILKYEIATFFSNKKQMIKEELDFFFNKILNDRCKLRDIYNNTVKIYQRQGYINSDYSKSKEVKKLERELNLVLERIVNLKNDNRVYRKFNDLENIKNKEVIIEYILNKGNDENKNSKLLELIGINSRNFVKFNVSKTEEEIKDESKIEYDDERLIKKVARGIKFRMLFERIHLMFGVKENILMLSTKNESEEDEKIKRIENPKVEFKEKFSEIIENAKNNIKENRDESIDIYE